MSNKSYLKLCLKFCLKPGSGKKYLASLALCILLGGCTSAPPSRQQAPGSTASGSETDAGHARIFVYPQSGPLSSGRYYRVPLKPAQKQSPSPIQE